MGFDEDWAALVDRASAKGEAFRDHLKAHYGGGETVITQELDDETNRLEKDWRDAEAELHDFANRHRERFGGHA